MLPEAEPQAAAGSLTCFCYSGTPAAPHVEGQQREVLVQELRQGDTYYTTMFKFTSDAALRCKRKDRLRQPGARADVSKGHQTNKDDKDVGGLSYSAKHKGEGKGREVWVCRSRWKKSSVRLPHPTPGPSA